MAKHKSKYARKVDARERGDVVRTGAAQTNPAGINRHGFVEGADEMADRVRRTEQRLLRGADRLAAANGKSAESPADRISRLIRETDEAARRRSGQFVRDDVRFSDAPRYRW